MTRILTYKITDSYNGITIGDFLKKNGYSHPVLVQLKKTEKGIKRNDIWAYVTEKLYSGDTLTITLEEKEEKTTAVAVQLDFGIVYEDEDIIVINKPANMPVHPSMNNYENTLANALAWYNEQSGIFYPFRCLNRLDRDTTGLTIISKNALSAGILSRQVAERQIHRGYCAICQGLVPEKGTINAPIARKADSTIERQVDFDRGETAITHYKRIAYDPIKDLSFVSLSLETGRTHQIRVHMKYLGHPLIGDFLYNPDVTWIKRQALHAASLEFVHPITQKVMQLEAPLPEDLQSLFPSV